MIKPWLQQTDPLFRCASGSVYLAMLVAIEVARVMPNRSSPPKTRRSVAEQAADDATTEDDSFIQIPVDDDVPAKKKKKLEVEAAQTKKLEVEAAQTVQAVQQVAATATSQYKKVLKRRGDTKSTPMWVRSISRSMTQSNEATRRMLEISEQNLQVRRLEQEAEALRDPKEPDAATSGAARSKRINSLIGTPERIVLSAKFKKAVMEDRNATRKVKEGIRDIVDTFSPEVREVILDAVEDPESVNDSLKTVTLVRDFLIPLAVRFHALSVYHARPLDELLWTTWVRQGQTTGTDAEEGFARDSSVSQVRSVSDVPRKKGCNICGKQGHCARDCSLRTPPRQVVQSQPVWTPSPRRPHVGMQRNTHSFTPSPQRQAQHVLPTPSMSPGFQGRRRGR